MADKKVVEEVNNLKPNTEKNGTIEKKDSHDLLLFFVGIILLGVGLFMLSQRVVVHTSWGFRLWGMDITSGLVIVPLIIGIIWQFVNPKSIIAKIFMVLGAVIIVAAIIMSVRINFVATSLYEYILIIGMSAAGAGLLLRVLFRKRD